jgi:hypothetical protein
MKFSICSIILLTVIFSSSFVLAQNTAIPSSNEIGSVENPYIIPQNSDKISIDGKLNESAWQDAVKIKLQYETWPGENVAAPVKTETLLFFSNSHLYVAFKAYDPEPESIRANFTERDQIWYDDYVVLFVDTFNDERRAFVIMSNPLGVQADDIASINIEQTTSWDAIYESVGNITDWGYEVEMAIPFNQLRFQRSNGDQVWGINLRRMRPRSVFTHIDAVSFDLNNDSQIAQFMKIRGFEGATPGKNIEFVPTLTGVRTDERSELPNGNFKTLNEEIEAGLSASWGLTANIIANGTINPDFSQVEADAYQLDINEPFALHYSEKRPFFTEGSDYFSTLKSVVYTRTLRDPQWGIKLTGKEKGHTIGAYFVKDEITNLIFPGSQSSASTTIKDENTSTILRYKKDIGANYTIGLMATDREGKDYYNRLVGFDSNLRITNSDRIQIQVLGSSTKYPNETSKEFDQQRDKFNDHFIAFEYDHEARNWGWWLDYDNVGNGFRADMGFIPMVGFRNVEGGINYRWIAEPGKWWSNLGIYNQMNYYENQSGDLLRKNASIMFNYQGIMRSHSHFQIYLKQEVYNAKKFDLTYFSSCFGFFPNGNINFHTHLLFGDRIDYANTRIGKRFRIDPEIGINLGKHLRLDVGHAYEYMSVNSVQLYTANISQLSAVYHFNVRTFFRSIFQYVNYDYNVNNYTYDQNPEFKQLFTQLLFSYKINPFTVFFLGYSDNYFGNQDYNLTQSDRTVFMKLSYAWVM